MSDFNPDWVSPPGDTIADLLEERGWTLEDLAEQIGLNCSQIEGILRGDISIDYTIAKRLEWFLGGTAEFWITREAQYRAELQRRGI